MARLAVLICIAAASYRTLAARRRAADCSPLGTSPRASLAHAAICLQLLWLAAELLLASALLLFSPYLLGGCSHLYRTVVWCAC